METDGAIGSDRRKSRREVTTAINDVETSSGRVVHMDQMRTATSAMVKKGTSSDM